MTGEHTNKPAHGTEDQRVGSIRAMLNDPIEQTAPNNQAQGWRRDCDYLLTELDDKSGCLGECIPFLRAYAKSCEACEGSGEKIVGNAPDDYWSEPCEHCKPTWDLIERIQPPQTPIALAHSVKEEDDVLF